jgi:hypothetical protein
MPEHRHRMLRAVRTNSRLRAQTSGRGTMATPAFDLTPLPPRLTTIGTLHWHG